ncbi:MAG: hypothetical protein NC180_11225 [Muribaculaceae bacterium]|nr:hypothetical protein [Roseburia sp.]MCM1430986.1 hypothetical protein [Muribaculaceae bacterium]MCM1493780.1 hypothetical protein [Muribaculaceae bacterium]
MEEINTANAYDEMIGTRDVQILKSIVPFLDYTARRQAALLIQYLEFKQMRNVFSSRESSMAACAIPETPDRRSAILGAIRQHCTPKEQETIDTILNLFCIMENYDTISGL